MQIYGLRLTQLHACIICPKVTKDNCVTRKLRRPSETMAFHFTDTDNDAKYLMIYRQGN